MDKSWVSSIWQLLFICIYHLQVGELGASEEDGCISAFSGAKRLVLVCPNWTL